MPRRSTLLVLGLGLLALLLQALAAVADSLAIHEREELYNAAHAWIVHGEGAGMILPLQYQWFCGGCAVDAVVGAGWFGLLGPSVLAWRLVGLTWWTLALVAGMVAARRVSGNAGAAGVALLFAFAPPAYQELGLICNGNHPEGGAILAAQLVLAVLAVTGQRAWARELCLLLQAVLVGFGLYFVRSLVLGIPLLLMTLALARTGWRGWLLRLPLLALGLRLGAQPLFAIRAIIGTWPLEPVYQADEWKLSLAWVPRNFASLFHPLQIQGIWGDVMGWAHGLLGWPGFLGWGLLLGALVWGLWRAPRPPEQPPVARWAAALIPALLATFLGLYLVYRLAVSMQPGTPPYPQQVRYLGIIAPVALLAAGVGFGLAWRAPRARWLALAGLIAACTPGVARRARTVVQANWGAASARNAPDWCFQAERLRGNADQLTRAGRHTPQPLLPYAAGTLVGDPRAVMEVADDPAAATLLARPAEDPALFAWQRGRVTGACMLARDDAAGSFEAWAQGLAASLAPDPPPGDALLESAWCQGREALLTRPTPELTEAWTEARPPWDDPQAAWLLAAAVGAQVPFVCPEISTDTERVVLWGPPCDIWMPGLPLEAAGWGMGVTMAELWGRDLQRAGAHFVAAGAQEAEAAEAAEPPPPPAVDAADAAALRAGFERGWRYGAALYWLPGRAPQPVFTVE